MVDFGGCFGGCGHGGCGHESPPLFSPRDLGPGLLLYPRSGLSFGTGLLVSGWTGLSSSGLSVSQPTSADMPEFDPATGMLAFNGSADFLQGDDRELPNGNMAFTVWAWCQITANDNGVNVGAAGELDLWAFGTATTGEMSNLALTNGCPYWSPFGTGIVGSQPIDDGGIHLVLATWDGGNPGTGHLYVDTVLQSLQLNNLPATVNVTPAGATGLKVGGRTAGAYFPGKIGGIGMLPTVITARQHHDLFTYGPY